MLRLFATLCWCVVGCAFAGNVHAQQNPNGRLPVTTLDDPFLFLIRDPVVHAALNLTSQQKKDLTALNDRLDMPLWSMRNKGGDHIAKTMGEVKETTEAQLSNIFSSGQLHRLNQIETRTLGMKSFRRKEVASRLTLSDEQSETILATLSKTSAAIVDLTKERDSGTSLESLNKKARELKSDEQKQILAQLNREQQQKWAAMLGKRIDVSRLGRLKFKAPELVATDDWINSAPLTLQQLKGKVVALHFYAFA